MSHSLRLLFCAITLLHVSRASGELGLGESFVIPVSNPKDHVFDTQRGILYASRWNGDQVLRYDVRNRAWLSSMVFGGPPRQPMGLDISPDGRWLYAATSRADNGTTAYLGKFDLSTGVEQGYSYSTGFYEGGGHDIAMSSNGKALLTSGGLSYLREIDLASDTVSTRPDAPGSWSGGLVRDRTGLFSSGDRGTTFVWEGNITSGPGFVYTATSNSFGAARNLNTSWVAGASVNRDGSLISTPVARNPMGALIIRDHMLNIVRELGVSAGAQFDPRRDRLYVLDTTLDQIIAYSSLTWSELFRFPVGEPINDGRYFQQGHMGVSMDGRYLFMNTETGIRVYGIPEPGMLSLVALASLAAAFKCSRRPSPAEPRPRTP